MKSFWILVALCTTLLLAACAPAPLPNTGPVVSDATPAPPTEPPAEPGHGAAHAADATALPAEQAAEATLGPDGDMGQFVRQLLAQQLQIDAAQIEVVSVEPMEWPDACLGISSPDLMCAQVITPGYRVVLAVDGQEYVYHTNADGSNVQIAEAPEANIGTTLLIWQQTVDTCQSITFGEAGVEYGPCMGVHLAAPYVSEERMAEMGQIVAAFAPFQAETPAGIITLNGQGSAEATPAQQRMIAEWARQGYQEALAGRFGASWGFAFGWHREGGVAGFCDDLSAYVTGQVLASTCRKDTAETLAKRWLEAPELEQLYSWVDTYAPFEFGNTDNATGADSMTTRMVFMGTGTTVADAAQQQLMVDYAATLYANLTQ
jgi:hypothetical protein